MMYLETADIDTATAEYASRFKGAAGEFLLKRQTEITLSLLRDLPKATVLDVGGGHAQLAEPLVENGFEVTVTGSDDRCIERLAQRIPRFDFEYKTCDSLQLPFEDRSFDVVMSFRLLSHVRRWPELIAELSRVAKYCVLFDYADKRSFNFLYNCLFEAKRKMEGNTRHFNLYSRGEISRELAKNGFQKPAFKPQFLCPMVVHRQLKSRSISSVMEGCFRVTGMTQFFGSPIIVRSDRGKTVGPR
ncbi:bifunctional 2-polyprenyl-6-hydroxyphenol methylase/3-demethylubiquinol 3-O-methyltransferase UbiG [Desulforhopalus sp. IMCC35007]|uniref:class I SAM-dependent methyltransferase n=1 Tax=Desulforhopalus sp. IMCC35007 TaxID=2569543 RepID=UPI0010AE19C9|nr:class I SAM-dependent methyltransferase [Desulforhopalus sp. IMCC35007]TKB11752.1 class I SAM-dependent methyltransferase [Desulforhopalus sp. IMCC35007]